jgi:hypothetical protein
MWSLVQLVILALLVGMILCGTAATIAKYGARNRKMTTVFGVLGILCVIGFIIIILTYP